MRWLCIPAAWGPGEGDHFRGPPVPTHTLSLPLPLSGLVTSGRASLRSWLSPGPPPGLRPRPRLTLDSNFTGGVSSLHLQRTCQGRDGLWAPTLSASCPLPFQAPFLLHPKGEGLSFYWSGVHKVTKSLSRVRLFATVWSVARQAPLSMGFFSKNPGVCCHFLLQATSRPRDGPCLQHWQGDSLPLSRLGSPYWRGWGLRELGLPCESSFHIFSALLLSTPLCANSGGWGWWEGL